VRVHGRLVWIQLRHPSIAAASDGSEPIAQLAQLG